MLGVSLLTVDPLALAMFVTGLWAWNRHNEAGAGVWMSLAVLAKEVLPRACGRARSVQSRERGRRATIPYLLSALPAMTWRGILVLRLPGSAGSGGSLGFPGVGLLRAIRVWSAVGPRDLLFTLLALLFMGLGVASIWHRNRIWKWLMLPWVLIGLVSSRWVWGVGNNALRVLAPLLTLGILATIDQFWRREPATTPATP